jgi:hypothetical protein
MAEEGFIENIGELTNKNFDIKMEEFSKEFKFDFKSGERQITYKNQTFNFSEEFLKSKEDFINEKVENGFNQKELDEQATKDLKTLGIVDPTEAQIESLSNSYQIEITTKESIREQPIDSAIQSIPEKTITDTISVVSDESKSIEERKEIVEKLTIEVIVKDPVREEGFKKMMGDFTMDELKDEIARRGEKTKNIEEKGLCQRMKEYIEKKYNETSFKTIGLVGLLAFLGYEFLNSEVIAGTGCMVTIANVNTNCRAMDFTVANQSDGTNKCIGLPALCQDPVVPLDGSNPPVNCTPNYTKNPIQIDKKDICSQFCNSKYLIGTIKNNSVSYNCEKCDIDCAFRRVFQVLCNIASDIGSGVNDLWEFLKKWGFYIIIVVAIVIVVYLITKVIQGAREIKHILYDTETGQTKTISSHDDLATLLANNQITIKSTPSLPPPKSTPSLPPPTKFRSKK